MKTRSKERLQGQKTFTAICLCCWHHCSDPGARMLRTSALPVLTSRIAAETQRYRWDQLQPCWSLCAARHSSQPCWHCSPLVSSTGGDLKTENVRATKPHPVTLCVLNNLTGFFFYSHPSGSTGSISLSTFFVSVFFP